VCKDGKCVKSPQNLPEENSICPRRGDEDSMLRLSHRLPEKDVAPEIIETVTLTSAGVSSVSSLGGYTGEILSQQSLLHEHSKRMNQHSASKCSFPEV